MKREQSTPRAHAADRIQELGMLHANTETGSCWNEAARYRFTLDEIETIEQAAAQLHVLCLRAVQHVIDHRLYDRLRIPAQLVPYIEQSWKQRDPFIYGRFDLAYDGSGPPKMMEFNADTPTGLLEASLVQYDWMQQQKAARALPQAADQFNFIHESLLRAWKKAKQEVTAAHGTFPAKVHFTAMMDAPEDAQTVNYMADVADEAGIGAEVIDIAAIGADGRRFFDLAGKPIAAMFKLYPWEWLPQEKFGPQLLQNRTGMIEPAWKMLLSNKGIMAILWELYPGHPNLLPTYDRPGLIAGPYVTKPFISREGQNVTLHGTGADEANGGEYGGEGLIYQAYAPLPDCDGYHPIIGAWVTGSQPVYPDMPYHPRGGEACGMGVREDRSRITRNESAFVPHYFLPGPK